MKLQTLLAIVLGLGMTLAPCLWAQEQTAPAESEAPAEGTEVSPDEAAAPTEADADAQAPSDAAPPADAGPSAEQKAMEAFSQATSGVQQQLKDALDELDTLRQEIKEEQIPLTRKLSALEAESIDVREEFNEAIRSLNSSTLNVANLKNQIKARKAEAEYLSNLFSEYTRNFESRLHIVEVQRYEDTIRASQNAPADSNLSPIEVYEKQLALVDASLDRLEETLGGTRFTGNAVDENGFVQKDGTFVLVGPIAFFRSADGEHVGTAEQRLGSLEPSIRTFATPTDTQMVSATAQGKGDTLPIDPTLGNAHVIEETQETLIEHIQKGGPVMVPIFALAGAALLVALYKWIVLLTVRSPSRKNIRDLLDAVAQRDKAAAERRAKAISGPTGKMLLAGVEHMQMPRELVEEVMYEQVLSTRLRLQRMLPFVSIAAASAPLLGLLGTVTGIINTFKLITVFGSGDVKTLSGGISEALITTEFGLIVAIPSLLLHAFLSRKARGVIDQMEKSAVALVNQLGKTPYQQDPEPEKAAA